MKTMKSIYSWCLMGLALAAMLGLGACDDETEVTPDDPIAAFQYSVGDGADFLTVTFTNFSQNATGGYAWNFGDGNTSTEENPVHTYAEAGSYTVTLTATGESGTTPATRSETFTLDDPDKQLTLLAGSTSKVWYLQREDIALGVGPTIGDNQWWSFGGVTPLGDRPCILDDAYTFNRSTGAFELFDNGTIFSDAPANGGWIDEGCYATDTEGIPSDFSSGSYTFDYDAAAGTLTLNGLGAYIGLASKTAAGDNPDPIAVKTYTVMKLAEGEIADSLHIALAGDGFGWNFYLVSYHNPADLPAIPSAEPAADFNYTVDGFTVAFANASRNADSYSWDFGDGNSSSDADPMHTYAAAGTYSVTLTASGNGSSVTATKDVIVSSAEFSAAVLSADAGKTWKLAGAGSYKVGPAPGSGEWWGGPAAEEMAEGGARACQANDEFIFFNDGAYHYNANGDVFAEGYMGGSNACMAEADLVDPWTAFGSSTSHTFTVTEASGDTPAMVTVSGTGAFIGFNKASNAGELPADGTGTPATSITYQVVDYQATDTKEILVVAVDYSENQDGTAFWTMTIEAAK